MTLREIGEFCGLSETKVWRILNPDAYRESLRKTNAKRTSVKQAWAREHDRYTCPRCGGSMGIGTHRKGAELCLSCRHTAQAEERDRRRRTIQRMWMAGESRVAIADAIGYTPKSVTVEIARMRADGWDLPYRYAKQRRDLTVSALRRGRDRAA